MGRKIMFVIAILALVGAFVGYQMWNKPHLETANADADAILTPSDLLAEFTKDEAAANTKYLDKILQVKGKVLSINTVETGSSLSLDTGDMMASISCGFEAKDAIVAVKVGDEITVKGFCAGMLTDVSLERCSYK